ncbi:hypothetical protein D9M68_323280 [compost metagenome]
MARQQPLDERHRPAFERLRQKRVVGVGDRAAGDVPGLLEIEAVQIRQEAHQFGNGDGRVGVVQLNGDGVRQRGEVRILLQMPAQDVLQRGGGEEIFLAQPQFLAGRRRVGGVENAGQAFRLVALPQRADVVAGVEGGKQDRVDRLRRPEAKRVDTLCPPADGGRIEGRGDDAFGRLPDETLDFLIDIGGFDDAAEADFVGAFAPLELPGIAVGKPGFRQFHLPAIGHLLAEEAVHVADAVAIGGHVDGRHRFHETGGETAKTAIAERRIRLEFGNDIDIDTERSERITHLVHQADIGHGVAHQPADEKFEREIVNALGTGRIGLAGGIHPLVGDAVAGDQDRGRQPVVRLGNLRILADAILQAFEDFDGELAGFGRPQGGLRHVVGGEPVHHETVFTLLRWEVAGRTRPGIKAIYASIRSACNRCF